MTTSSRYESPSPPNSSGMTVAVQPMSATLRQSSASKAPLPSSAARTLPIGQCSARNPRAWSRSSFCSSENSKFMTPRRLHGKRQARNSPHFGVERRAQQCQAREPKGGKRGRFRFASTRPRNRAQSSTGEVLCFLSACLPGGFRAAGVLPEKHPHGAPFSSSQRFLTKGLGEFGRSQMTNLLARRERLLARVRHCSTTNP